ncbi:MAG: tetratricopeptide repeat protein, partial [Sphaerospermopsis sp. SIO1G2]|nr:tetratricopeptide repeat protein [Sphaerospermopsis sp. SIO1G2]
MYKHTSFLVAILLLGSSMAATPVVAQNSDTLVVQGINPRLKELLEQGRRLVDAGEYNRAIAVYQEAGKLAPRNAKIHSGIGYLYAQQSNFRLALASYRRAIALDGNNSDFYYALGYIKGNLGDTKGAKEAYRRSIQLNRGNFNAYLGLGVTQTNLGDYEAAMWAYEEAVKLNRNSPRVYELMGAMFKIKRQTQQASNVLRKALSLYRNGNDSEGINRVE